MATFKLSKGHALFPWDLRHFLGMWLKVVSSQALTPALSLPRGQTLRSESRAMWQCPGGPQSFVYTGQCPRAQMLLTPAAAVWTKSPREAASTLPCPQILRPSNARSGLQGFYLGV